MTESSSFAMEEINKIIAPMYGLPIWQASFSEYGFLMLEIGKPIDETSEEGIVYTYGEWHVLIYSAGWYLQIRDIPIVGSGDKLEEKENKIKHMVGQAIEKIDIQFPSHETILYLQNDVQLHIFPNSFKSKWEHWMLFTPEDKVLSIGPGTIWSYE